MAKPALKAEDRRPSGHSAVEVPRQRTERGVEAGSGDSYLVEHHGNSVTDAAMAVDEPPSEAQRRELV